MSLKEDLLALLFEQTKNGIQYEVRNHGASIRLYRNAVCHSDYNENRVFNGSVWDLMFVSSLLSLSEEKTLKILVLGVGGGNVIRMIQKYLPNASITGVDIDPINLKIAKEFFGVSGKNVRLVKDDAIDFLGGNKSPIHYDIIIDDIFTENEGEPMRALPFDSHWYDLVRSRLTDNGLHIVNMADLNEFKSHDVYKKRLWMNDKLHVKYLKAPKCENAVFVFSKNPIEKSFLSKKLNKIGIWPVKASNPYPNFQLRNLI